MSKEAILKNIRVSLQQNTINYTPISYQSPMKITQSNLIEEYKINQTNNKAIIKECTLDTLLTTLQDTLKEIKAKEVLYNTDIKLPLENLQSDFRLIPYTKSIDTMREQCFGIDTSIVKARCAVANLGIIGLSSNTNAPRLSSLITNTCIYLLEKNSIVENLYEATIAIKTYEKNRSGGEILPSNIIFVAGPSRTADIELQTVFGVHGSRVTYVLLY
ncbi:LutC/YkgG family protein [Helicobacter apodemus]|uniref:Lactate utilization protein C n=1 Tax=Helicobacter apodemus TaxID=135569 RepID=A0A2U8FFV0_9HELI|nr:LUD domain-containing protein [Helicobacter apodemus]AWI34315.1 lactate utilization protein C [Helicobacter apodemus]